MQGYLTVSLMLRLDDFVLYPELGDWISTSAAHPMRSSHVICSPLSMSMVISR